MYHHSYLKAEIITIHSYNNAGLYHCYLDSSNCDYSFLLLTISLSDNSGLFAVVWENNTHTKIYLLQRQRYNRSFLI